MTARAPTFYEFFAGGGMARAGLGSEWTCLFANDFDAKKGEIYARNWGSKELKIEDVGLLKASDLPGHPDLVWASFPCQDLSLAGGGAGLRGDRSGTFWPFWKIVKGLIASGRKPPMIVLENVCGTLSSHGGKDFAAICDAFSAAGYRVGALVIDACHFVAQSRPRVFFIAVSKDIPIAPSLVADGPLEPWHTRSLKTAFLKLDSKTVKNWIWWRLQVPGTRNTSLAKLIESNPTGVAWHPKEDTQKLLRMMSPANRRKVQQARLAGKKMVGTLYRRTRPSSNGGVQRAEVRFDGVAGCLRTPAGGSSRQILLFVDKDGTKSRLISAREAARLMGLPDSYELPERYNEAYHLVGDGVVPPVVRHIRENILDRILLSEEQRLVA